MKRFDMTGYEQEDFDNVRDEMTVDKAIEILNSLAENWFPYCIPAWDCLVTSSDFENYEICCAIDKTIEIMEKYKNETG